MSFSFKIKNNKLLIFSMLILSSFLFFPNQAKAIFTCDSGTLNDTCTISTAHNLESGDTLLSGTGDLIITGTGSIVGYAQQATEISVANLEIQAGGIINFNGKGLTGGARGEAGLDGTDGNTSGVGGGGHGIVEEDDGWGANGGGGGGGGHGGIGGQGRDAGAGVGASGIEHDQANIHQPTALGSGGGGGAGSTTPAVGGAGGDGGGAIKLTISETFNNDGAVTANGEHGSTPTSSSNAGGGGGGSGGSIWISAGSITGSGTIGAIGGSGLDVNMINRGGRWIRRKDCSLWRRSRFNCDCNRRSRLRSR